MAWSHEWQNQPQGNSMEQDYTGRKRILPLHVGKPLDKLLSHETGSFCQGQLPLNLPVTDWCFHTYLNRKNTSNRNLDTCSYIFHWRGICLKKVLPVKSRGADHCFKTTAYPLQNYQKKRKKCKTPQFWIKLLMINIINALSIYFLKYGKIWSILKYGKAEKLFSLNVILNISSIFLSVLASNLKCSKTSSQKVKAVVRKNTFLQ